MWPRTLDPGPHGHSGGGVVVVAGLILVRLRLLVRLVANDDDLLDVRQGVSPCGDLREVGAGSAGRLSQGVLARTGFDRTQHDREGDVSRSGRL
jgi:hypothetical protein